MHKVNALFMGDKEELNEKMHVKKLKSYWKKIR